MKILLISHFFPPTHNAGTENYTLSLGKELQLRGHRVEIICGEDWDFGENYWNGVTEDTFDGLMVHRVHLNWIKADNPNKNLYDNYLAEKWFDHFISTNKFDLAHVTSVSSLGVGVLRSIRRLDIPLILTLTDFWFICPSVQLLRKDGSLCDGNTTAWECQSCLMGGSALFNQIGKIALPDSIQSHVWPYLARIPLLSKQRGFRGMLLDMNERKDTLIQALSLPDMFISPSIFVREMFSRHTSIPIKIIPHGHNLSWLNEYQRKASPGEIRFGYIGQILRIKGLHLLVEAFLRVCWNCNASLNIWGDPKKDINYTSQLQALINGNQSIKMHGQFNHDRLGKILKEIDVLVVPSIWYENAPLAIQEAFAAGIPVIATNLGGMAEAVEHGISGLLFERGDVEDLARQMRRIVEEPGLLDTMRTQIPPVKIIAEEVDELEAIYQELVAAKLSIPT